MALMSNNRPPITLVFETSQPQIPSTPVKAGQRHHIEHRTREETRQEILNLLQHADRPLTRTQIARAIGRAKAPHIVHLIDELVEEGLLKRELMTFRTRAKGYVYAIV